MKAQWLDPNSSYNSESWKKNNSDAQKKVNLLGKGIVLVNKRKESDEEFRKYCGRKISEGQIISEQMSKSQKASYIAGRSNLSRVNKRRQEDSEYANWHTAQVIAGLHRLPNSLELSFDDVLQENFPNEWLYVGDYKVWFDNSNPDFINCNGKKKIIELNGCAWHCCQVCGKEHPLGVSKEEIFEDDLDKISDYKKYGYETLVIWEHEFNDVENIIDKVKQFMYNPEVSIIKLKSIERIEQKTLVYDIETKNNHNFFAYGILVHNSEVRILCRWNKQTQICTARFLDLRNGQRRRVKVFGPEIYKFYSTFEIPPLQAMHTRFEMA